jgi:thioredoxin-like negative regulator of GroEL
VDVEDSPARKKEFEVSALPVALVFNREGLPVVRLTGEQSESDFLRVIEPLLDQ